MPEAPTEPLALEATALRYAARTLTPPETSAFEARLAGDQQARDALAEAVRLSAAAMKQVAPAPSSRLRSIIRARLARRGHPIAWIGLGAGIVAAAALFAVHLADHPSTSDTTVVGTSPAPAIAPEPRVPAAQVAKHEEPEPTADRDGNHHAA